MIYYELSPSQLEAKASDHFEKGMIPERVKVDRGTIVIDRAIQESGNTGLENFTKKSAKILKTKLMNRRRRL